MSNTEITVWESEDGRDKIKARRSDDGIEIIALDGDEKESTSARVWFPVTAAPTFAGWLMAPFDSPGPFDRATTGLRAVADALEQVEAELRAALSFDLLENVRQHIENSIAVLRMGNKPHEVPVNTGSRLLLALDRLDRVYRWLSGIAPKLRVHQIDQAMAIIEAGGAPESEKICIIFDGPPGPVAGRFVEVETEDGKSIGVGEWSERPDGMWALTIER